MVDKVDRVGDQPYPMDGYGFNQDPNWQDMWSKDKQNLTPNQLATKSKSAVTVKPASNNNNTCATNASCGAPIYREGIEYIKTNTDFITKQIELKNGQIDTAINAAKENVKGIGGIDCQIFEDMKDSRRNLAGGVIAKLTGTNCILTAEGVMQKINQVNTQLDKDVRNDLICKYRARHSGVNECEAEKQVDAAIAAVNKQRELQGDKSVSSGGFMDTVKGFFYDSEKGNFKFGGILGGAAAFLLGSMFLGGEGGIMGMLSTLAFVVAGVFIGSKIGDEVTKQSTPSAPSISFVQEQGLGQAKGTDAPAPAADQSPTPTTPPVVTTDEVTENKGNVLDGHLKKIINKSFSLHPKQEDTLKNGDASFTLGSVSRFPVVTASANDVCKQNISLSCKNTQTSLG